MATVTMKLNLLSSLLILASAVQSVPKDVTTSSTTSSPTTTEIIDIYDYIVLIGFNLVEDKVPEYLLNIIYNQTSAEIVTTQDILTLYGLETVNRTTTFDFMRKLNISLELVFSLDGLDKFLTELSIDFKEFYNIVIMNNLEISGSSLKDVLTTLNVDSSTFSEGIAYGDPDPYQEFKKGNYTYETVVAALEKANKTLDDLFDACRDEFVAKALTFDSNSVLSSLGKYGFGKSKALALWRVLGLSMENVHTVPSAKKILDDFKEELNRVPNLGVRTAVNTITINKRVYDTWNDDEDLIQPYAQPVSGKFVLQIVDKLDTELNNIILLRAAALDPPVSKGTYIEKGTAKGDVKNCQFITLDNSSIVTIDVVNAVDNASYIHIPKGNITNLVLGSPLVCNTKVYGLAREISGDEIVLDSFSGVGKMYLNGYLSSVAIVVYVSVYFS